MLKRQKQIHFNKPTGFSLLDASILLIIFALVAISFLAVNSFENIYKQTKIDYKRIQNIKSKIEAIKIKRSAGCRTAECRYTVLPCPAPIGGNGVAQGEPNNTCLQSLTKTIDGKQYYYGEIPWVTLGIAKEEAINRYGNFYGYVIPALNTEDFSPDGYANYKIFDTGEKNISQFTDADFTSTNQFSDSLTSLADSSELCTVYENRFYEGNQHSSKTGIYLTIPSSENPTLNYPCEDDGIKKYVDGLNLKNQDNDIDKNISTSINCFSGKDDFTISQQCQKACLKNTLGLRDSEKNFCNSLNGNSCSVDCDALDNASENKFYIGNINQNNCDGNTDKYATTTFSCDCASSATSTTADPAQYFDTATKTCITTLCKVGTTPDYVTYNSSPVIANSTLVEYQNPAGKPPLLSCAYGYNDILNPLNYTCTSSNDYRRVGATITINGSCVANKCKVPFASATANQLTSSEVSHTQTIYCFQGYTANGATLTAKCPNNDSNTATTGLV
ncbi:hypothetical protein EBR43_12660, partial [bacterium]|nr:hypothetical protein [bacterium]